MLNFSLLKQENSSLSTHHSSLPKGYAVIFGNEVKGVTQNIVDMSDGCLEIPQFGTKHSLNVSVTAGISGVTADKPNLKGRIYTTSGVYVGTDFDVLPQGVYVVNGKN